MVFSSTLFVFIFLPIVLGIHAILAQHYRNIFILFASLFFYAWGEQILVLIMLGSIGLNYFFGNTISKFQKDGKEIHSKIALIFGVAVNLLILIYYKYAQFFTELLSNIGVKTHYNFTNITLPIGISFFTFQCISYLIDVYRKTVIGQKNILNLGMYVSFFPQLIAGPIVRYEDICKEIINRKITTLSFETGINRFIIGFAKKILIANNVGILTDKIFSLSPSELSTSLSWIGILCYTMQIYYDFSGYSDMAIGLGKMFGFNFKENFEHPYIATSIREFWRRWHISLSSWFKDYLYIPLGGNRKGKYRTYINLFVVFLLTGLWHGASLNFVFWGAFHGVFIIIEHLNMIKLPSPLKIFSHIYTLLVVLVGWVFFRSENLEYALQFIGKMFSVTHGIDNYPYIFINNYIVTIFVIGLLFFLPLRSYIEFKLETYCKNKTLASTLKNLVYISIFILSLTELALTTYNPFIYFRF